MDDAVFYKSYKTKELLYKHGCGAGDFYFLVFQS